MKRNQKKKFFDTRKMVLMAVLIAIQIVLARYLAIHVNETLRISFETVPLAFAGMWLGPVGGMVVALVSDLLGTFVYGYGLWFPPIAFGPMVFAAICGWGTKYIFRSNLSETKDSWKVIVITVVAGAINALAIGVFTTTLYSVVMSGAEFSFPELMRAFFDGTVVQKVTESATSGKFQTLLATNFGARLISKPFTIAACSVITAIIHRTVYRPAISPIVNRNK